MREYSATLSNGNEIVYTAKTVISAVNKALKEAKKEKEKLVIVYDTTDIETNEECPVIWER